MHEEAGLLLFRRRRRRKLLSTPLSTDQRRLMHAATPLCAALPKTLQARHEGIVQVLLAEKHLEAAGGLVLTESMHLAIAGQAALLQLRRDADYYPDLDTVLIYPTSFFVDQIEPDEDGFVHEGADERAGESWQRGAVVLSWEDADRESVHRDGYNVVLHEFAHQLDDQSGEADGTPLLRTIELAARWPDVFQPAFERHRRNLRRGCEILFDEDAAESPSEFFATAVELFFELPRDLEREFRDVYRLLTDYLELNPAAWSERS
jgi:MtfA peptidase